MGKCGPEKLQIQTLPRSVKNIKINHNADELMMILNRITIFNVIFFTITTMFQKFDLCSITLSFYYKQLGSGLSPESCLYLQGFRGSKLLKTSVKPLRNLMKFLSLLILESPFSKLSSLFISEERLYVHQKSSLQAVLVCLVSNNAGITSPILLRDLTNC